MDHIFAEMKRTRRLRLDKTQTLMHYFLFFILSTILVSVLIFFIIRTDIRLPYTNVFLFAVAVCLFLTALYFARQKRSLQFTVFNARLNEQEFRDMFEELAKEMHWIAEYSGNGYVVATIPFKWSNWGTLITLIRDEDHILVNSICDLHNKFSTTSWGQNQRNIKAVKDYLRSHGFITGPLPQNV
jgi:hypothetical protein